MAASVASTSRVMADRAAPACSSRSALACTALCWRTSSAARWKPKLSACQIRCCSSPNACRLAPAVGQGLLEQPQVGEQLAGIAVGQAGRVRRPGAASAAWPAAGWPAAARR